MNMQTISLVGLGKLGLCLAAIYAAKGKKVIGIDILPHVVEEINRGVSPMVEPGLIRLIADVGGTALVATLDHARAVEESDVTIILTATPSLPDGGFSNAHVEEALTSLAQALRDNDKPYHLFVISSTVIPGSIEGSFIPLIERISGKKLNEGFGICYDPDFVALGNVIKDFMNPDIVLIGQSDEYAGTMLEELHGSICDNAPAVRRMSLSSAEVAKVSLNAYITVKISFANLVGNVCDKIPDANPDDITAAIGLDRRISPHYFKAGLSYGGTCFPRDTWALLSVLHKLELPVDLMRACNEVNVYQDKLLSSKVFALAKQWEARKVGILGLAFKPDTPVIVESPAIKLIKSLRAAGMQIAAYDPLAQEAARAVFGDRIIYAPTLHACMDQSQLCVLTLPSKSIADDIYAYNGMGAKLLLDCWRILDKKRLPEGIIRLR
jgi:UDPglucose 6-dehydrogenase